MSAKSVVGTLGLRRGGRGQFLLRRERRRAMSKALGLRCVWGLCGVLASVLVVPSLTRAEVTSDLSGSVVVWPKVVWTGNNSDSDIDRDTIIQLTNTSNQLVHVWCF